MLKKQRSPVVNCFQIINFDTLKTTECRTEQRPACCELLSNY